MNKNKLRKSVYNLAKVAYVLLFFCVAIILSSCGEDERNKKEILRVNEMYNKALSSHNAELAMSFYSKETMEYYEKLIDKALYADSAAVANLNMFDRNTVLSFRHRLPRELLRNKNVDSILFFTIDQGMVGKNIISLEKEYNVILEGEKATLEVCLFESGGNSKLYFCKEEGSWKLDLPRGAEKFSLEFENSLKEHGLTIDEYIMLTLEKLTGRKPNRDIYQPLVNIAL